MQRKTYTREFKLQAIALAESQASLKLAAEDLGIKPNLLGRWRSEYKKHGERAFSGIGKPLVLKSKIELKQLAAEKENRRLKLENEILKKALGIISSNGLTSTNL